MCTGIWMILHDDLFSYTTICLPACDDKNIARGATTYNLPYISAPLPRHQGTSCIAIRDPCDAFGIVRVSPVSRHGVLVRFLRSTAFSFFGLPRYRADLRTDLDERGFLRNRLGHNSFFKFPTLPFLTDNVMPLWMAPIFAGNGSMVSAMMSILGTTYLGVSITGLKCTRGGVTSLSSVNILSKSSMTSFSINGGGC